MQFLVIGKDGKDKKAMKRRLAVRQSHLDLGEKMLRSGSRWYGAVLLDDNDNMIGSMAVMNFPSEKELREWLKIEPYVTGKVWKTIEVIKCNVKTPWQFNRPESFFKSQNKITK